MPTKIIVHCTRSKKQRRKNQGCSARPVNFSSSMRPYVVIDSVFIIRINVQNLDVQNLILTNLFKAMGHLKSNGSPDWGMLYPQ